MITVKESIETALPAGATFAYLSEFANISEWDPGTPVCEKRTPGPVAVGSKYAAEAEFNGKRQPIDYVVTKLSTTSITLRGENKRVISVDTIAVAAAGTGSRVTYTAEFTLKGIAKLIEPFVRGRFQELAIPAVQGMKRHLDSLA